MPIINALLIFSIKFKTLTGNYKPVPFESVQFESLHSVKGKSSFRKKRTGLFSLRPCPSFCNGM